MKFKANTLCCSHKSIFQINVKYQGPRKGTILKVVTYGIVVGTKFNTKIHTCDEYSMWCIQQHFTITSINAETIIAERNVLFTKNLHSMSLFLVITLTI